MPIFAANLFLDLMFRVFRSMFSTPLRISSFTMLMCLFLLSSCRDSATLHCLEAVEAVIDANPEQACYMLDSINGTALHGEVRALHALLSTQADYQCYVPLTSDSLILIAACYYGASRPNYRAAMSHYYLGCTYTELGRDADAIRAYMQAIPLFPDTTVRQRALCYQNMARHYRNRNLFDESLAAFNTFRASMLLRGKPADVANADYQIALTYLYMGQWDEAEPRFRALIDNAATPYLVTDNACFQLAKIACYHSEHYDEALHYLNRHIASVGDARRLGPDYSVKGDVFLALGQTDSARHYFGLSLIPGRDVYADCNTYYKLVELDLAEGRTDSVPAYLARHTQLLDSIARMQSCAEVERVRGEHQIAMHDRMLRYRHTRFMLLGSIIVVTLALLLVVLFATIDNRRKTRYIRLQKQLAQNRAEMLALTAMPDDADSASSEPAPERLLALRRQRIDYCREVFAHTPWRTRISYLEHSSDTLTLKERTELQQVLIDSFADVMIDFRTQCPALTASDLQFIIFTLSDYSIRTISLCTAISENALRSRKTRLKGKMPEELYQFIFG